MIKYFNLKLDKPDSNGGVLRVNTDVDLGKKVRSYIPGWKIEYIHSDKKGAVYDVKIPRVQYVNTPGRDALGGKIGVPARIEDGLEAVLRVKVTAKGNLVLKNKRPATKKTYLSEISEYKARKLKEDFENWNLQRAYIFE